MKNKYDPQVKQILQENKGNKFKNSQKNFWRLKGSAVDSAKTQFFNSFLVKFGAVAFVFGKL